MELAKYIGRDYTHGSDIRWTIDNTEVVHCVDAKATAKRIWERRIDEFFKRDNKLAENCKTVYSLIMGQCTEYTREKLEGLPDYNKMNLSFDMIKIVMSIKGLHYQFDGQTYHEWVLHQAKKR
jgi:hypothetical protein